MRCKWCGGESGYYYRLTVVGEQHMKWDGDGIHFEDISTKLPKYVTCIDCGKRLERPARILVSAEAKEGQR